MYQGWLRKMEYKERFEKLKNKESLQKGDNGIIQVGQSPKNNAPKLPKPKIPKDPTVQKVVNLGVTLMKSDSDHENAQKHIKDKAHLFNGQKLHSAGHTNEEASNKVKELRSSGVHATYTHISGPKTGNKSKHAVMVPNSHEPLQKGDVIDLKSKKLKDPKKAEQKRAFYENLKNHIQSKKSPDSRSTDQKNDSALNKQIGKPENHGSGFMNQPYEDTESNKKIKSARQRMEDLRDKADQSDFDKLPDHEKNYHKMKEYIGDKPESLKHVNEMEAKQHDEPYYGNPVNSSLTHYTEGSSHPQAFPHNNVDPKGVLGKEVHDFGHDPFTWNDIKYQATKKVLQENKDKPMHIHTRSDLIGHDDYMEHLNSRSHKIFLHGGTTSDKNVARLLHPGSPSLSRLLNAGKKLKDAGHDVTFVHDNVPGMSEKYPQNGFDTMSFARAVKEKIPDAKIDVNHLKDGPKLLHFHDNVHKTLKGDGGDE